MSIIETENDIKLYNEVIKYLEKQLDQTNYWLSFAEAKNGAILAINVAFVTAIITIFDKAPVFCVLTVVWFFISCCFSLISFFPNTQSRPKREYVGDDVELNLMFYGDIAKIGTVERYIQLSIERYFHGDLKDVDDKKIKDIASEILMNSRITMNKYVCFKNAVKMDFVALLFGVILLCVA